jgi:hypothetical protein
MTVTLLVSDARGKVAGLVIAQELAARPEMRNGARGRNRTADTMIFSHVLYQLSYPGSAAAAVPEPLGSGPASGWKRAYGEAKPPWQARSGEA